MTSQHRRNVTIDNLGYEAEAVVAEGSGCSNRQTSAVYLSRASNPGFAKNLDVNHSRVRAGGCAGGKIFTMGWEVGVVADGGGRGEVTMGAIRVEVVRAEGPMVNSEAEALSRLCQTIDKVAWLFDKIVGLGQEMNNLIRLPIRTLEFYFLPS